jgi:DNA-3-methyladenine glycosylase I
MSAIQPAADGIFRCPWCLGDPLYIRYHDEEWGVPLHDDRRLFEMLILEGAQAGLSWFTILKRRENYRQAYEGFDPERIAQYGEADRTRLLADAGIIRNRLKIDASIKNARAFLKVREEKGSFNDYIWGFTGGKTLRMKPRARKMGELPCRSPESEAMSKDLIKRGFRFVGPLICYAHMQATGMVDDHLEVCWKA